MAKKLSTVLAFSGLLLVLFSMLGRPMEWLGHQVFVQLLVIGFAAMFLGALWKVIIEMNED